MSPAAASAAASLIRRRCCGMLDPLMRRAFSTQALTQLDIKQTQSQSQIQTSQALTRRTNKVMGGRVPCPLLPSQTNPHSWRTLPKAELDLIDEEYIHEREPVHDFIFHKGLLYAVDTLGALTIYDFNNPSSSSEGEEKEPSFSLSGSPELARYGEDSHFSCFLVESPDGNDLFLVYRLDLSDFMVFKLNSEGKWASVSTIGDMAIFMGINQSVSLRATDFPDILKPNSIYYTERKPGSDSNAGVVSLEDETHQFFEVTTSCQDVLNWPRWERPVWFTPATTS